MECTALLVEDDERIRQALGLTLGDEGCEVIEAASGEEALNQLAAADVDVVLLDLMLPGIDGLEVCRRLRATGDLPIIIVSARTDTADVIDGLEAGGRPRHQAPGRTRTGRADPGVAAPSPPDRAERRPAGAARQGRRDLPRRGGGPPVGSPGAPDEDRVPAAAGARGGRGPRRDPRGAAPAGVGLRHFGDTRLLDVHIRRLRRKVERDPDAPECVVTMRGSGYKTARPA
jgi:two-component system response regulator MtrA